MKICKHFRQPLDRLLIKIHFFSLHPIGEDTIGIGVARVGHDDQKLVAGTLKELFDMDFGTPLHSLVIPGHLHILEQEAVNFLKLHK